MRSCPCAGTCACAGPSRTISRSTSDNPAASKKRVRTASGPAAAAFDFAEYEDGTGGPWLLRCEGGCARVFRLDCIEELQTFAPASASEGEGQQLVPSAGHAPSVSADSINVDCAGSWKGSDAVRSCGLRSLLLIGVLRRGGSDRVPVSATHVGQVRLHENEHDLVLQSHQARHHDASTLVSGCCDHQRDRCKPLCDCTIDCSGSSYRILILGTRCTSGAQTGTSSCPDPRGVWCRLRLTTSCCW